MRDFPQELVFALVFGAVWLAQLVYKWVRRKVANLPSDGKPVPVPEPAPTAGAAAEANTQAPPARPRRDRLTKQAHAVAAPPQPVDTPPAAQAAATVCTVVAARLQARRYSRAALMPDRRAVQDAVVIAAIVQPCHAQRQRDGG